MSFLIDGIDYKVDDALLKDIDLENLTLLKSLEFKAGEPHTIKLITNDNLKNKIDAKGRNIHIETSFTYGFIEAYLFGINVKSISEND